MEKERMQLLIDADVVKKFKEILAERGTKKGDISAEIQTLIKENLSRLKTKTPIFIQKDAEPLDETTQNQIEVFYDSVKTYEKEIGRGLIIFKDQKSQALYTECHIAAEELIKNCDLVVQVSSDPEEQEEAFKMNRDIQKTHPAFKRMISDAKEGRQFSDLVIEYRNDSYRPNKPLKVLGGQHRILAIQEAFEKDKKNRVHGIRVYFNLSPNQIIEISDVANTNINIPLDLRDRMYEEGLLPAGKLIEWCVHIGILNPGDNFAEKRLKIQNRPTVRMMRAFIVNFYAGVNYKKKIGESAPVPEIPDSGGMDEKYKEIYEKLKGEFMKQKELTEAALQFVKLNNKQMSHASEEYKYRVLNLAIISAWAFVAGNLSQHNKNGLDKLYRIPVTCGNNDPLNSSAMDKARDDSDPQNYRMGVRFGKKERGRLTQLFYRFSLSDKLTAFNNKAFNEAIERYNILKGQEKLSSSDSVF